MTNKILQPPMLKVLSQSCLQQQTQNVNGSIKNVHVVVKNHPFTLQMALLGGDSTNSFNRIALEAVLLYDSAVEKTVDFIKVKPLEFSGRLEEGSQGTRYNLDLSIKVLSSQHEDSLFKVRLQAINQATRQPIPGLVAYSAEILVISKPEVLKKKTEPKGQKKRTRDDQILSSLSRIETRLEELAAAGHKEVLALKEVLPARSSSKVSQPTTANVQKPQFESSVTNFITSFCSLTNDERPEKVRRVLRSLSSRDIENFSEVIDLFFAEGLSHHLLKGSQTAGQRSFSSLTQQHPHPLPVSGYGYGQVVVEEREAADSTPSNLKFEELPLLGIESSSLEFDLPSPLGEMKQLDGVDLNYDVSDLLLGSPEHFATDLFETSHHHLNSSSYSAKNNSSSTLTV